MKRIIFLAPLFLLACTANQKIFYQMNDLTAVPADRPIPALVDVRVLENNRDEIDENSILFDNSRQIRRNGKQLCINAERHYKKEPVVNQVTKLMVDHFNKVGLFEAAYYDHSNNSN